MLAREVLVGIQSRNAMLDVEEGLDWISDSYGTCDDGPPLLSGGVEFYRKSPPCIGRRAGAVEIASR